MGALAIIVFLVVFGIGCKIEDDWSRDGPPGWVWLGFFGIGFLVFVVGLWCFAAAVESRFGWLLGGVL